VFIDDLAKCFSSTTTNRLDRETSSLSNLRALVFNLSIAIAHLPYLFDYFIGFDIILLNITAINISTILICVVVQQVGVLSQ
jgi:hypothetical protein